MKALNTLFLLVVSLSVFSQTNPSETSMHGFTESLVQKKYSLLEPHLSESFKIGDYPKSVAGQIIPQIYEQYPQLNSIRWDTIEDGNYLCDYQFYGMEEQSSKVILDEKHKILKIELFDQILSQSSTQKEDRVPLDSIPFLSKKQVEEFYDLMVSEIETLDAEAIETRNLKKDVSWDQYVKVRRQTFIEAKSWTELARQFNLFGNGFVNLHSHFSWAEQSRPAKRKRTKISIGYTFPEITFFDTKSKKNITHLNNQPILDVFDNFSNYECAFNTELGCLDNFCSLIKRPYTLKNGETLSSLTYADGEKVTIEYAEDTTRKSTDPYARYMSAVDTSRYPNWNMVAAGYKVALFRQKDMALIRIKDFLYFNGMGGDARCEGDAPDSTTCGDVRLLRRELKKLKGIKHLIFDVQNNGGGNENSSFIAEFSQGPFYDLAVQFRKTKMLEDKKLRPILFYGSNRSENWFQSILNTDAYKNTEYGDFLPIRGDFCVGDENCALQKIEPNPSAVKFETIYILTNQNCVSSCDDFVWRMQQFSGAKVIGQEQAGDATYSRIGVVFYLDENGKIQVSYEGGNNQFRVEGTRIAKMTIPYSKTVKHNGSMRQGVAAKLDLMIPVTKDNFETHQATTLEILVEKISKGESF